MISETKVDLSFPTRQFYIIYGFSEPYNFDRGILLYIRDDITSKLISTKMTTEGFVAEINLKKEKSIICFLYNPKNSLMSEHLQETDKNLDLLSCEYDNIMLFGDFNAEPTETVVYDFCENYNLANLVKEKACFKTRVNQLALI